VLPGLMKYPETRPLKPEPQKSSSGWPGAEFWVIMRQMQNGAAILCRELHKSFQDVQAVRGVNLEVMAGECFGLLGPNGAGKTTTVEILEGITSPDRGEVRVLGHSWGDTDEHALRERFGVQLQETRLSEKLTVYETVRLFRSFYRAGQDVDRVIRTVALEDKRNARVGKLSGGQKQRLALACALVGAPELLFLDEPTTGLDPQARFSIWEMIENFKAAGVTILLTTHYMEEAERLCDRVAVMDLGKVIAQGSPAELIDSLEADEVIRLRTEKESDLSKLENIPGVKRASIERGDAVLHVESAAETIPPLLAALSETGVKPESLTTHKANLEDVFLSLTGRKLRDA